MADVTNLTNFLNDVADAIRTKKNSQAAISAENFDTEIRSINSVNNQNLSVTENGTYTPDANHTGFGNVSVNVQSGTDTSDATATENDIISPKTAYLADGTKHTGAIPNNGAINITPAASNQSIPAGYTSGGTVYGDANLLPANIASGVSIFNVTGTAASVNNYFNLSDIGNGQNFMGAMTKSPAITPEDGSLLFGGANNLTDISDINFSNLTNASSMFRHCYNLANVPAINGTNLYDVTDMFLGCTSLTDASINNILGMCASATNVTNKLLSSVLDGSLLSRVSSSMSNYQAFINAGWEIYGQLVSDDATFATDTSTSYDGIMTISNLVFTDNRTVDGTISVTVDITNTSSDNRYVSQITLPIRNDNDEYVPLDLSESSGIGLAANATVTHTFTGVQINNDHLKSLNSAFSATGGEDHHDASTSDLAITWLGTFFKINGVTKTIVNNETVLNFTIECIEATTDDTKINIAFQAYEDNETDTKRQEYTIGASSVGDTYQKTFTTTENYYNPITSYAPWEIRHSSEAIIEEINHLSDIKTINGMTYQITRYELAQDTAEVGIYLYMSVTNNTGDTVTLSNCGAINLTNKFDDNAKTYITAHIDEQFQTYQTLADGETVTFNTWTVALQSFGIDDYEIASEFICDTSGMNASQTLDELTFSNAQYVLVPDEDQYDISNSVFSIDVTYDSDLSADKNILITVEKSNGQIQEFYFTVQAGLAGSTVNLTDTREYDSNTPAIRYTVTNA